MITLLALIGALALAVVSIVIGQHRTVGEVQCKFFSWSCSTNRTEQIATIRFGILATSQEPPSNQSLRIFTEHRIPHFPPWTMTESSLRFKSTYGISRRQSSAARNPVSRSSATMALLRISNGESPEVSSKCLT